MNSQQKKKPSLILGILSIVLGLLFPIVGLILGIIGLVLAFSYQKESGLDYKTEKILNIVGLVVSVLNWILAIAIVFRSANNKKALNIKLFCFIDSSLNSC